MARQGRARHGRAGPGRAGPVTVTIKGTTLLLQHRFGDAAMEESSKATRNAVVVQLEGLAWLGKSGLGRARHG